jgi:hypothetical protein
MTYRRRDPVSGGEYDPMHEPRYTDIANLIGGDDV